MATEKETIAYTVKGVAQFSRDADIVVEAGIPAKAANPKSRFCGFDLDIVPFTPNLNIRYKTIINKKGASEWATAGTFSGTTDRRRKLIGFAIELTGTLADQYTCLLYTSPSPRDATLSRMPSSA